MKRSEIKRKFVTYLVFILLVIVFLFAYGWQNIWKISFGAADMGDIEFTTFTPSRKPNHALICPQNYCKNAKRSKLAPIFKFNVATLKQKLFAIADASKNIKIVASDDENNTYRFVEYSKLMRFPDTIRVKLITTDDGGSTLAIYSQSQIGHGDLGVNAKRINNWLQQLSLD